MAANGRVLVAYF